MAYSEALAARIRSLLAASSGISERRMFGGLCFPKDGHMFVGLTGDDLMARGLYLDLPPWGFHVFEVTAP